jgi:hypothetical protein
VLLRGDYGKDGSIYVPELNPTVALRLIGDLNSPKSAFIAADGEENTDVYQTPVIPKGVSAPLSWLLSVSADKAGHVIEYSYTQRDFGDLFLDRILYGGKYSQEDKKLAHGNHFVQFTYAGRDDNYSSFLSGGELRVTRLLTKIAVGVVGDSGESLQREYVLTYRSSAATGRQLLATAQACQNATEKVDCSSPTKFTWQDSLLTFSDPKLIPAVPSGDLLAPAWHPGEPAPSLTTFFAGGDYNADGRRDLFVRTSDEQISAFVLQSDGNVLTQANVSKAMSVGKNYPETSGQSVRHLGNAEIFGEVNQRLAVLDWAGNAFGAPTVTSIPYTGDEVLFDATGEGQTDIVAGIHAGKEYVVTLYKNQGSSDKQIEFLPGEIVARFENKPGLYLRLQCGLSTDRCVVLVKDGDKVVHLVRFSSPAEGKWNASAYSLSDLGISTEAIAHGYVFADINGDGLDDIVYTSQSGSWTVQINEDFHFQIPIDTHVLDARSKVGRAATLLFSDADGRTDLIYPVRRLAEFCVAQEGGNSLCADSINDVNPKMDLSIYEYDILDFRLDSSGSYVPHVRSNSHLVGQANRAQAADIFGDGYINLLSPFDGGVLNGRFKEKDGSLVSCPPKFGCGLHVTERSYIKRDDRSDAFQDLLIAVSSSSSHQANWTYYPISSSHHLYTVPALNSSERYLDSRRYYFTSSMPVVGEFTTQDQGKKSELRFDYGAGEYNTAGRGFDGFKWIIVHDTARKRKDGAWFGQDGPYRGKLQRSWSEEESDEENDYLHGSPGKHYLEFERTELKCKGPKGNAVTIRYHCEPTQNPSFAVGQEESAAR